MPIDPEFLAILVCPQTRKPLRPATPAEVERVNQAVRGGSLRNRGGEAVRTPVQEGLVPEGESVLYPIVDGIPVLLTQEAIGL